jgi:hypothetical protein
MGCSQSKTEAISIKSSESESRPKSVKARPLPNQQSDRIVEDCIVVWLLNGSSLEIDLEKAKLSHVVSTVKIFTDRDECVTYIINIRVEKIFLIVPAIESFLESIQNLPQLEKIYILNSSLHKTETIRGRC